MSGDYSAASSMIGYLFQLRYSMYVMLRNRFKKDISIETLDDVALEKNNSIELIQLKHKLSTKRPGNLTDGSTDLWKTLRVWSDLVKSGSVSIEDTIFTLVTTASVSNNTAASYLKDNKDRNPQRALEMLNDHILRSNSDSNKKYYDAFSALSNRQQKEMLGSVYVVGDSPDMENVKDLIKEEIMVAVRPQYVDSLFSRLEGWWYDKVSSQIYTSGEIITGKETHLRFVEITEQLRPDSLPIDFLGEEPEYDLENDDRQFVKQIRLISLKNARIKAAIRDYYRAYKQRSKWLEEDLISQDELYKYEKTLHEEWEEEFESVKEQVEDWANEDELQKKGREIYRQVIMQKDIPPLRDCNIPYLVKGSYHMLANRDELNLGWHPHFVNRLRSVFKEVKNG